MPEPSHTHAHITGDPWPRRMDCSVWAFETVILCYWCISVMASPLQCQTRLLLWASLQCLSVSCVWGVKPQMSGIRGFSQWTLTPYPKIQSPTKLQTRALLNKLRTRRWLDATWRNHPCLLKRSCCLLPDDCFLFSWSVWCFPSPWVFCRLDRSSGVWRASRAKIPLLLACVICDVFCC